MVRVYKTQQEADAEVERRYYASNYSIHYHSSKFNDGFAVIQEVDGTDEQFFLCDIGHMEMFLPVNP